MLLQGVQNKRFIIWLVPALSLLLTVFATLYVRQGILEDAVAQFSFSADQIQIKVRERLQSYELILRGGAALFESSDSVSRHEWHHFVSKLEAERIVPGVQGIGFSLLIRPEELAKHEAAVRAEGFADYQVRPPDTRDIYSSIVYLEPLLGANLRAFGYDMFAEPVRRAAMERARDTGSPALSGKVTLVQETGKNPQPGMLMYVSVYRPGWPTDTVEQRRLALLGWAYSPYRMNDFMTGILHGWESSDGRYVDLHIYDGLDATPANSLFDGAVDSYPSAHSPFFQQRQVEFYGHAWLLEFDRLASAPGLDYQAAWLVFFGGIAFSGLLHLLLASLFDTRDKAKIIAQQLTVDIREHEQRLQESEFRWRFAVEGAGDGLWDWDIPASTVFFSTRWKNMLGYRDDEIGNSLDEWSSRVHPDEKDAVMAAVQACHEGKTPDYAMEHRVRCKDGRYKWMLDRGMVVSRSQTGEPLRMIGTQKDIDESKQMEMALRQRETDLLEAQRIGHVGSWKRTVGTDRIVMSAGLARLVGFEAVEQVMEVIDFTRLLTAESLARFQPLVDRIQRDGTPYATDLELVRPDNEHVWLHIAAEVQRDAEGSIATVNCTAADITKRKEDQMRIESLSRFYATLSACNAAIARCKTHDELFAQVCEIVVRLGGMKLAWIGLIDPASERIVPVHSYGEGKAYVDGIEISVRADDPRGQGPTGTAAREGRAVWLDDFENFPTTLPWRERARPYGWRASAAIPLLLAGSAIGALTFYSTTKGYFAEELRNLLQEVTDNISFALDKLAIEAEARAKQAELVASEQRFRNVVEQSIAGAFIIQDGKIIYANPRASAILGYTDEDKMLELQPMDVVAPKDREYIGTLIARMLGGELAKAEALFTAVRKDGTTTDVAINAVVADHDARPAIIGLMQDVSDKKVAEEQIRRYARQLEHTFMQTVELTTTLSEMRDAYTAGHERRVAAIAVAIGATMGLDENCLEGLRVGGYLHDVGKITVPAEILAKPTRLTPTEYQLIQQHARAGYDVLKEVDFPWPVAQIALQHHERIDGSGYPQGLKGEEIILEARITAVADVIESMASHRPYRPGLGIDKALAEIERGAGSAYDPAVVQACLQLFREKGFVIPED